MSETTGTGVLPVCGALEETSAEGPEVSFQEALNRDPENYRGNELEVIVKYYREMRIRFLKTESEPKEKKPAKTASKPREVDLNFDF